MYGFFEAKILGTLVDDVTLKQRSDGKNYCYFSVVVNSLPYRDKDGAKVEPPPTYFNLSAGGVAAELIARKGRKGSVISCSVGLNYKKNVVEKDGVKTVYNDVVFPVLSNQHIEIIDFRKDNSAAPDTAGKAQQQAAPAASAPEPQPKTGRMADVAADEFMEGSDELLSALDELPI